MRTAIFMLLGVVALVAIGSFVPQQNTSAQQKVDEFLAVHGNLNALAAHLGLPLTEVFVSPVFYLLLGALYLSLGACVTRRVRALWNRTRRGGWRSPQYWGETGSWLFHASFLLLLVAVVGGKATGFQGIAVVPQGDSFVEARSGFDTLQEGLLFNGKYDGFMARLNSFKATYATNGEAKDYVSNLTIVDRGHNVMTKDVRVNDFLAYDGVDFYQQDYGWAPHIVVQNPDGHTVFDGYINAFGENKSVQTGILKVPDFGYLLPSGQQPLQLGARLAVFPDAQANAAVQQDGSLAVSQIQYSPGGVEARNPVLQLQLFAGDLKLNQRQAQSVNELDTSAMQPYFTDARSVPLVLGKSLTLDLPSSNASSVAHFTVSFPDLKQYSLFMVKKDQGVPLIYAAFFCIMVGLCVKLYLKPWLEARSHRRQRT